MNFQKIAPVETSTSILDIAFRKAREKGKAKKLKGNWLQIIRQKEALKLDVIKHVIYTRLDKMMKNFPDTTILPEFYIKLMRLTLDFSEFKKSLGAINWASKKISSFQKEYIRKIIKSKDRSDITELSKQFYGRLSSCLKQIDSNLIYLEQCRKVMRTYPDIKEMFTICIYGFPNVGKTTLLNKLTGTKAEVNSYAFTTRSINAGYIEIKDDKVQVLDVPGTLARENKLNDIEFQAEIVMEDLADVVIYVFDLSETGGYEFEKQEQLYKKLGKKKKIFVYLSKQDLLDKKTIKDFKHKHYSLKEIKDQLAKLT
jgi:nucleolar GTP-binding protein